MQQRSASVVREPLEERPSRAHTHSTRRGEARASDADHALSEARGSEGGARPLQLTKWMQERLKELQIADSDTAFEVAKEVASMFGGVGQYGKTMQRKQSSTSYAEQKGMAA